MKYLYGNELDKACFAHGAAYSDSKDLAKRAISDKIFKEELMKLSEIGYDGYQRVLASMAYKFFDKKPRPGAIATSKAGVSVNE